MSLFLFFPAPILLLSYTTLSCLYLALSSEPFFSLCSLVHGGFLPVVIYEKWCINSC
jgi:hypothetical protein